MEQIKVSEKTISWAKDHGINVGMCPEGKFVVLKGEGRTAIGGISSVTSQIKQENPTLKLNIRNTFNGKTHRGFISPEWEI